MKLFLKISLTVLALAYCFTLIDLSSLAGLASAVRPQMLWVALLAIITSTTLGAIRFKILFDPIFVIRWPIHVKQYFMANYFNLLLPSSIGGDAARVVMLGNVGASRTRATVVVLLERMMGLFTLLVLSAGATFFTLLPDGVRAAIYTMLAVMIFGLAILVIVVRLTPDLHAHWAQNVLQVLREVQSAPRAVTVAFAISVLFQLLNISITYCAVLAYDIEVAAIQVFALVPLVWLATSLPISVSGIGVREVAFVYLFAEVGVSKEASVLMSITTYTVFIAAGVLGGLWLAADTFFSRSSSTKQQHHDATDHQ